MKSKFILLFGFLTLFWSCSDTVQSNKEQSSFSDSTLSARQSYANIDEVRVDSLFLNLSVNFDTKTLEGSASWKIISRKGVEKIILDVRSMDIQKVLVDGKESPFELSKEHPVYGQGLWVPVKEDSRTVQVFYKTKQGAEALQWMSAGQTESAAPFLYTQSQAILARSWVPCMDLPSNRFTYRARIQCDPSFLALMSAGNPETRNDSGVYHFSMPQPIPSYLLALAAGKIEYKAYNATCGIYAEPSVLQTAYSELKDLPEMIRAAEALYGPYRWGKYDVLFLPSSFPFGGMENPRLTFATPTILAGDRSLVALVAHELAHSWSGNLVTNKSWNDFWLNEGFTVYFEQRIMEEVYGKEYADMLSVLGYGDLRETLDKMGPDNPESCLYLDMNGRDPDEGVSDIAYEKGRFFLRRVEEVVGRDNFDAFLNDYFHEHAFQTMDTKGFLSFLRERLLNGKEDWLRSLQIDEWVYGPGLPDGFSEPVSTAFNRVDSLHPYLVRLEPEAVKLSADWTTHHWLRFLRKIETPADTMALKKLEDHFHFSQANAEIADLWFILSVKSDLRSMEPAIRAFLTKVGRRKFLTPLYASMIGKNAFWKERAKAIYAEARKGYHAVSVHTLDELFEKSK